MSANDREKGDFGRLALSLARGMSFAEAGREAGISEKTARRRWRAGPLRRRVARIRDAMLAQAVGRISDSMAEAADALRGLLAADAENVRLAAARTLLDVGIRLKETTELAERVAALERQQEKTP